MPNHQKRERADLKAKVALEAIKGQKTANEETGWKKPQPLH
jgi:hypothetical protein